MMIERQVIVTWYTPEEKLPPEGQIVLATITGHRKNARYEHAFALVTYYDDGAGWEPAEIDLDEFTVHAWCDLEPYGLHECERWL